jgi:hypothetical protein
MTIIAFDTLAYANKLKSGGVEPLAAEAQAEALFEIMNDYIKNHLSTKQDLKGVEIMLGKDIGNVGTTLREEIVSLERRMYGFIVKTTLFTVTILGGLQTLFKFVH